MAIWSLWQEAVSTQKTNFEEMGMSTGFNWFKEYEITDISEHKYWHSSYKLTYLDGDSTSHSAGNIIKVQNLIEKYGGKRIPQINTSWIDALDYKLDLIEPIEMVEICNEILANTECDEIDMRHRIEWFKKLSEDGYYLSYDYDY